MTPSAFGLVPYSPFIYLSATGQKNLPGRSEGCLMMESDWQPGTIPISAFSHLHYRLGERINTICPVPMLFSTLREKTKNKKQKTEMIWLSFCDRCTDRIYHLETPGGFGGGGWFHFNSSTIRHLKETFIQIQNSPGLVWFVASAVFVVDTVQFHSQNEYLPCNNKSWKRSNSADSLWLGYWGLGGALRYRHLFFFFTFPFIFNSMFPSD